jgi:shikimate dehydrogenase
MLTPNAGMEGFLPEDFVAKFDVVMDIVYKPLITPLLEAARNMRKTVITGDKMLLYQGVEAFKLWTGKEAPVKVMRKELSKGLI